MLRFSLRLALLTMIVSVVSATPAQSMASAEEICTACYPIEECWENFDCSSLGSQCVGMTAGCVDTGVPSCPGGTFFVCSY